MNIELEYCPLSLNLHAFATFPCYMDALYALTRLAAPESWRFRRTREPEAGYAGVEILARYLEGVYARLAKVYNTSESLEERDSCIHLQSRFACFHTGLFSRQGSKAIYALFANDPRADDRPWWHFNRFVTEGDELLSWMDCPPSYPRISYERHEEPFYAGWQVVIRYNTMRENELLMNQIPPRLHSRDAFHAHLRRVIQSARARAKRHTNSIAPILQEGTLQYAMPLYLTDENDTECALVLKPDAARIYIGHEVLPVRDIYHLARQMGPVTAPWLTKLVSGAQVGDWRPDEAMKGNEARSAGSMPRSNRRMPAVAPVGGK